MAVPNHALADSGYKLYQNSCQGLNCWDLCRFEDVVRELAVQQQNTSQNSTRPVASH